MRRESLGKSSLLTALRFNCGGYNSITRSTKGERGICGGSRLYLFLCELEYNLYLY